MPLVLCLLSVLIWDGVLRREAVPDVAAALDATVVAAQDGTAVGALALAERRRVRALEWAAELGESPVLIVAAGATRIAVAVDGVRRCRC